MNKMNSENKQLFVDSAVETERLLLLDNYNSDADDASGNGSSTSINNNNNEARIELASFKERSSSSSKSTSSHSVYLSSCFRQLCNYRIVHNMSRLTCRFYVTISFIALIIFAFSTAFETTKSIPASLHPRGYSWGKSAPNLIHESSGASGLHRQRQDYREYPWTFVCVENKCQRQLVTDSSSPKQKEKVSFDVCWLTCGPSGSIWPTPGMVKLSQTTGRFYPEKFFIRDVSGPSDYIKSLTSLAANITRMGIQKLISDHGEHGVTRSADDGPLYHSPESTIIEVHLSVHEDTSVITEHVDESYELKISSVTMGTGALITVNIKGATFFGIRHGLETLSQLIAYDEIGNCLQIVDDVNIQDGPAYPIRGLMMDTARNFIPIENLYRMVDAMSYNKMNTLHWHLTDSNSFPFRSKQVPQMSLYGAYEPSKVYTIEEIKSLVFYALVRGVRIIPELDAPAHAGNGWQWGNRIGLGDLVVCVGKEPWRSYCGQPPCGQLNPINENVYNILQKIYEDLLEAFNVDMFHIGGDEVVSTCWDSIPGMKEFMRDHQYHSHLDVWGHFHRESYRRLKAANKNKQISAIVWSSGLTGSASGKKFLDPDKFIIQIWEPGTSYQIGELLRNNYKLIFSNVDAMYLDMGQGSWLGTEHDYKYHNWQVFYDNDLDKIVSRSTNGNKQLASEYAKLVLGGIATLWSEKVNENTMDAKLWPRGAAVAERLWSNPKGRRNDVIHARLNHQTKRLKGRGIHCSTLQPESCLQMTGNCDDPQHPMR